MGGKRIRREEDQYAGKRIKRKEEGGARCGNKSTLSTMNSPQNR
jgi:hypothetical protein